MHATFSQAGIQCHQSVTFSRIFGQCHAASVRSAAGSQINRVLRPDGTFLVAVPADPKLWSDHDVAVDHVRRYTRETLSSVLHRGGFDIAAMTSWNVLLRPVVAMRRKKSSGSDLDDLHPVVNGALTAIITAERYLPVKQLPGVSLLVTAHPRG